jgi:hypothetical protein
MSNLFNANDIRDASYETARDMVRHNLNNSPVWLARGLVALLKRQTPDEVDAQTTHYDNDRGFNASDAQLLTSFAQQCQRWLDTPAHLRRYDSPLSPKQLPIARRKMHKYAGQLVRIAQGQSEPVAA